MIKKILPIFISVFVIIGNMLCANASDNVLRGVDVRRGVDSYTIELTSTLPAKHTKTILSSNRIIINLKDISISNNMSTKFEGHKVIDNVMVEPYGTDGVNVMVQGDNIAFSSIQFKQPTPVENVEDSVKSSFTALANLCCGNSAKNRAFQFGVLLIFGVILLGEIRFITSKYKEFEKEKELMLKNIEETKDFRDYLPGYGRAGVKKPYTTPIYSNPVSVNTNPVRRTFRSPETVTLNSLLHNSDRENVIIDRIVNNTPVFGALSGINTTVEPPKTKGVSNPLEKERLRTNLKHLEEMTAKYRSNVTIMGAEQIHSNLRSRLNRVY